MTKNIAQFVPPQAPTVPFSDMVRLAEAIAKSRLFGISTPDQALALMAIAQAEGRHPALAARDYHIIGTTPSKKAEAMLRDFLMAGGKVEWHELTDEAAEATFSHPVGGSVRIRWDNERVKKAGLGSGNHQKYPRQMKRSRVVSEGVRTVWPLATSGFYVPEEVIDFDQPRHDPAPPVDTRETLDQFATAKPADIIDGETGEVLDMALIEREARSAAAKGTDHFREHLRGLSREARAALKPLIGAREAPGELTVLAQRTDEAMRASPPDEGQTDAFGLPLSGGEAQPHSPAGNLNPIDERSRAEGERTQEPAGEHEMPDLLGGKSRSAAGILRARLPEVPTMMHWDEWVYDIEQKIKAGYPKTAILRDNKDNIDIFQQVDEMRWEKLVEDLGGRKDG